MDKHRLLSMFAYDNVRRIAARRCLKNEVLLHPNRISDSMSGNRMFLRAQQRPKGVAKWNGCPKGPILLNIQQVDLMVKEIPRTKKWEKTLSSASGKKAEKESLVTKFKTYFGIGAYEGKDTWFSRNWWLLLALAGIFLVGMFLRSYFYFPMAQDVGFSGNDPYYHKRVVDYIQQSHSHLIEDNMLNYPVGGANPRPPFYNWFVAVFGIILSPLFGFNVKLATESIMYLAPSFWGALTVFPVYFLAKDMFGKKAGVISAFLMAFMPSHIERSPSGFSDHDSIVVFFVVLSIFLLFRAYRTLKHEDWVKDWRSTNSIYKGFSTFFRKNKVSLYYSLLSGVSLATIALTWKGFPYALVIIIIYYMLQLLFDRFRHVDSTGVFICTFLALFSALAISFPYYYVLSFGTWATPVYFLAAVVVIGVLLIPTRDYPWIIVLPLGVIVSLVGYLFLSIIAPAAAEALITGQGYFVKTKLYSTIAEAQPPAFSKLIVSYAMIVFFLAVIGIVKAAFQVPKHWKREFVFIVVWAIVAVYMAMSAARFMFNATPVIAIVAGWVLYDLIQKINLKSKILIFYTLMLGLSLLLLGWWGINHGFGYKYTLFVFMAAIAMAAIPIIVAVYDNYDKRPAIMIMVAMCAIWTVAVIVMIILDENLKWDNFGTVMLDNINIWYFGLAALGIMVLPILIFITKRTFAILHIILITSATFLIIGLKDTGSFDSLFTWKPMVVAVGYSIIPCGILLFNIYFLFSDKSYRKETGRKVLFVGLELWVLSFFFDPQIYTGLAAFALFVINLYLLTPYRKTFKHKTKPMHVIITLFIVFIVIFPTCWFAIDASLPYEKKFEMNNRVARSIPDFIKSDTASNNKYFGAFGHGFTSEYWRNAFDWLSKQDVDRPPEERPGFVSWWDYGFWCAYLGQHPTAADNFQYGYQFAGSFIASQNESEAVGLMVARTIEGGIKDPKMKEEISDILDSDKYFGPEKKFKSNIDSSDLSASEKIFEMLLYPEEYIEEIKNNPEKYGKYLQLLYGNARYASVRGMLMPLGEDKIIDLMADIEGITDKCIRYFAVDYRLFPFTAQNTGIFYAPIKLADKDVEDFLEYIAVTTEGDMTMTELEERILQEPEFRDQVTDYKLKYTDQFYDSMFYRCYIGYSGKDLGAGDLGVPLLSPTGEFASNQYFQPMQGWNMSHFRLVYRTTYYTPMDPQNASFPEDFTAMNSDEAYELYAEQGGYQISGLRQGAFFLKYYHGAQLVGKLRAEGEDGTPMPGVRITAVDEYGILHDVSITDENGNYNLTLPFGEVTVVASKDGYDEENELFSKLMGNEKTVLNRTVLQITDDQAMRRGNWIIKKDLTIKRSSIDGKVYYDDNDDGEYDIFDTLATEAVVEIVSKDGREITYNDSLENGEFNITNVLPAEYDIRVMTDGHTVKIKDPFSVVPNENQRFNAFTLHLLLPMGNISGNITFDNGTRAPSIHVELRDNENGTLYHTDTNKTGFFNFGSLLPGNYSLVVDHTLYKRLMKDIDLEEGALFQHNFTLTEVVPVSGEVYYEGIDDNKQPLPNARIQFIDELYPENIIVVTSDKNGQYLANLSLGNYTIYADYTKGNEHYTCLEEAEFRAGVEYSKDIELSSSIKIMGTLGIHDEIDVEEDNSTKGVLVRFRGESGNYFAPTNDSSYFSVYLPEGEYQISADLFLKGDYGVAAKHVSGTGGEEITIDLIAKWAYPVYGFVFWDRNGDMNLTIGNSTIDIMRLSEQFRETEPELEENDEIPEEFEDSTSSIAETDDSGTRADENVTEGEEETPFSVDNVTLPNATNDTVEAPPLYENLTPAHVEFRQGENVFTADTNQSGFFTRLLPLGDYVMRIETDEISLYETTVTVFDGKDDVIQPPIRPKNVTFDIFLGVDRDLDGQLKEDELLKSYELEFSGTTPAAVNATYNFRQGNPKKGALVPGEYKVKYLKEFILSGTDVRQEMETNITLHLGESDRQLIFLVDETVRFSGKAKTETDSPADNATLTLRSIHFNTTTEVNCDKQGNFDENVPFGMYFVRTSIIEGSSNFLFRKIMDISPGNSPFSIILKKARPFNITVYFDINQDGGFQGAEKLLSVPVSISADITSTHTTDYNGFISTSLLPGKTYNISIDHLTSDSSFKYTAKLVIVMPDEPYEIYLPVTKYIKVKGKTFWDKDADNTFDTGEEIADADISVSPVGSPGDYTARSNADGQWNVFLPIYLDNKREYQFSTSSESFIPDIFSREVSLDNKTFDIALGPRKLEYHGTVFMDIYRNDTMDPDELPAPLNTIIKFTTNSKTGRNTNATTDVNGYYSTELYPGEYFVEILSIDDDVIYIYEAEETVALGEDKLYSIPMDPGANVYGAVKYTDTDLVEHREIDSQDNNITIKGVGNDIERELTFQDGFYETYLPFGEYKIEMKGYTSNEYGMEMVYEYPETDHYVDFNPFILDFTLSKVYDRTLELSIREVVGEENFEKTVNQGETVELHLNVENKGNVKQEVTLNGKDLPEGWSTDITPREQELDIGESFEAKIVVRTSFDSFRLNEFKIEAKNEAGDTEEITLNINTHPKYDVEIFSQDLLARGFRSNETKRFNITVMNKGNAADEIKFYLKQDASPLWNITMQDEPLNTTGILHSYEQDDVYKNVSFKITAPNLTKSSATFNIGVAGLGIKEKIITVNAVIATPDISIADISFANLDMADEDKNVTMYVTIHCDQADVGKFDFNVYLDDEKVDELSDNIEGILQDDDHKLVFDWNLSDKLGKHKLEIKVDEDDQIRERDDITNNNREITIHVGPDESEGFNWRIVIAIFVVVILIIVAMVVWKKKQIV